MVEGGAKAVCQPQILLDGISKLCQDPINHPNRHLQLDIWIFGYLDYRNQFVAASPIRTSVWCSPAGGFFSRKNTYLVVLQAKTVSLAFY